MIDDLGLLVARAALGLSLASHGAQKAFGWFGGPGPEKAAGFMASLGLKPGERFAAAASYNEIGSGLLITLGLGGPLGPAGVISSMLVAAETRAQEERLLCRPVRRRAEPALRRGRAGAGVVRLRRALARPRSWACDRTLRHPVVTTLALAGGIVSALTVLAQRDTSPPDGTLATPTIKGAERNGSPSGPQPSQAAS